MSSAALLRQHIIIALRFGIRNSAALVTAYKCRIKRKLAGNRLFADAETRAARKASCNIRRLRQFEFAGAIAKLVDIYTHRLKHAEVKIVERGFRWELQVAAGGDSPTAASRQNNGQVVVVVTIAVANRTSVNDQAMVEQAAFPVGSFFELLQKVGKLLAKELVDRRNLLDFLRIVLMV